MMRRRKLTRGRKLDSREHMDACQPPLRHNDG